MINSVYWNRRRQCWSVKDSSTGRVVEHVHNLALYRASFHVSPSGHQKIRDTGRRKVVAWVKGQRIDPESISWLESGEDIVLPDVVRDDPKIDVSLIRYNPLTNVNPYFTDQHGLNHSFGHIVVFSSVPPFGQGHGGRIKSRWICNGVALHLLHRAGMRLLGPMPLV